MFDNFDDESNDNNYKPYKKNNKKINNQTMYHYYKEDFENKRRAKELIIMNNKKDIVTVHRSITNIVDAETGKVFPHRVGTNEENLYFKVTDASGYNLGGNVLKDSLMLFYESPDDYERHMSTVVNPEIKDKWHEKREYYDKLLNKHKKKNGSANESANENSTKIMISSLLPPDY